MIRCSTTSCSLLDEMVDTASVVKMCDLYILFIVKLFKHVKEIHYGQNVYGIASLKILSVGLLK